MKLRSLVVAGVAVAGLAAAPAANAQLTGDQPVVGTPSSLLAIGGSVGVSAPMTLAPGTTNEGSGLLTVTTFGSWVLKVLDTNAGAGHGHLVPSDLVPASGLCDSTTPLTSPLSVAASEDATNLGTVVPAGTKDLSASASAQTLASGSNIAIIQTDYSQPVGGNELLDPLCGYRMTARYSVSTS